MRKTYDQRRGTGTPAGGYRVWLEVPIDRGKQGGVK